MNKEFVCTKDLIERYHPIFTKRNITTCIISKKLPYIQMGRKRYFEISNVEKWLQEQQILNSKKDYSTLSNFN